MKAKDIALILVVVVLVAFTPSSPISVLARDVLADARPAPLAAPVGTAFTYQGQLTDDGLPADGVYDFQFTLWDAETSGGQIGSLVTKGDVVVVGGFFTVELDFGASAFAGEARWLEIGVRPGDSTGSYTTLDPRQKITPTPYALYASNVDMLDGQHGSAFATSAHNHWGQTWYGAGTGQTAASSNGIGLQGSSSGGGSSSFGVYGTSTEINGAGVRGQSNASIAGRGVAGEAMSTSGGGHGVEGISHANDGGAGVWGFGDSSTGDIYGVLGYTYSTGGTGVYGGAYANSGSTVGVSGVTYSPSGIGVKGYANTSTAGTGVFGESAATSGGAAGVTGISHATDGGTGIYGVGASSTGNVFGVYGWSQSTAGIGVYGIANAASGTTYGVRGVSSSPAGWGGVFDSNGNGVSAAAPGSGILYQGVQSPSGAVKFSVNGAGNVHSYGTVTADGNVITGGSFHYATPRTRVISIPSEAFLPSAKVDYDNRGNAVDGYGAHLMSGTGFMAAPVQLPQGAVVTQFQLWLYDNSSSNLDVDLFQCDNGNGWGTSMANLAPTGWPGYGHTATTSISPSTIDNTAYNYTVSAWASPSWDADNLRILAMIIWYTEADAE